MSWQRAILLIVAGAASALSLPPIGFWWVWGATLWFPLNGVIQARSMVHAGCVGLCFGFGYFVAAYHWIGFAFLVDADAYLWMMPFAVGGLSLFMALYWAIAMGLAWRVTVLPGFMTVPATLATAEWLRGHLFTGFPWAAPGLASDGMGAVLQLASVVGMPGLTLLVLIWAALPFALWQSRGESRTAIVFAVWLLALPAAFLWGGQRLSQPVAEVNAGPMVRLVQPNVSQDEKWRGDNAAPMFSGLLTLSASASETPPALVIWPEASVPFLLDEEPEALALIASVIGPTQTLLAGSLRRESGAPGEEPYYTSVLAIDGDGRVFDRYDKWRLVPGGEYLPLEWLLAPLGFRKVVNLPESLSAGAGPRSIEIPGFGQAGILICYEAIFPHDLVVKPRPRFIVSVTNDGWFGQSVGPYQHLAQVRMRAVEQGLPIARAANTGISAMIDSNGRFTARTELGTRAGINAVLPAALPPTIYGRMGDWMMVLVLAAWIFSGVLARCPVTHPA